MNSSAQTGNHRRSRSITASAIANLRACNEELRNNVKELKEDVDALNGALYKSKKVKVCYAISIYLISILLS